MIYAALLPNSVMLSENKRVRFMIGIEPQQLLQETAEFAQQIGKSFNRFASLDSVKHAATPRQTKYQLDKLTLYRYEATSEYRSPAPLLIVYALVNRPTMTDLQPERSFVRGLLDAGIDVWLIDWGYPDRADCALTLSDYIDGYLANCVEYIRKETASAQVDLLGICQGGVFSLCFTALYPRQVRRVVTLVTPVDFHTPEFLLTKLIRPIDVDLLVDTLGNVPGSLLNFSFLSLSPFRLAGQKYVRLVELAEDQEALTNFLRMEEWIFDSPDMAGEAFRQFAQDCFQHNRLIRGEMKIDGRRIDLSSLQLPLLNIYARQDHIVPESSARALRTACNHSDYSELAVDGGHIGVFVSKKACGQIPLSVAHWLSTPRANEIRQHSSPNQ